MSKLMLRRQCSSRIRHQLVLSLHRATSPCIPENLSFKSANSPFAERADRKRPLPIPLRRFFPAEWYLFTKLGPQVSLSPVQFFGVNTPLHYLLFSSFPILGASSLCDYMDVLAHRLTTSLIGGVAD
jgi:hypothetical protein